MSEIRKRKKGQVLNNNERQLILNLINYLKKKHSEKSISEVIREISKATGCSERTIYKIRKEASKGITVINNRTRLRKNENKNSRNIKYDSFIKSLIRKKIHNHFLQNISPTLNTILSLVNNDSNLPNFKRSTLHTLLKEIGFVYEQKGKKSLLTERNDLIKCRQEYLQSIQKFRNEKRWIVYTGQTIISILNNKVERKVSDNSNKKTFFSQPEDYTSACNTLNTVIINAPELVAETAVVYAIDSNAFVNNISNGFINWNEEQAEIQTVASTDTIDNIPIHKIVTKNSSENESHQITCHKESITCASQIKIKKVLDKEFHLKIIHAGSDQGFLQGAEFVCLFNRKTEETDSYEHWLVEKLLPKMPPNSVIVTDTNTLYHKKKENTIPSCSWKKEEIKNWLLSQNISIGDISHKKELLSLVKNITPLSSAKLRINEIAKEKGIEILRVPPFHYELNPLNMIWAQLKHYVKTNMKSFKIKKIKELIREGIFSINQINWINYINSVKQNENLLQIIDKQEKNKMNFCIGQNQ